MRITTASGTSQVRRRVYSSAARQDFARESEMLSPLALAASALAAGLPGAELAETFFEVSLAAGIADLVVVAFDEEEVDGRVAGQLGPVVDGSHVRTLTALEYGANRLTDVSAAAGIGVSYLRRSVLPALKAAGWVESVARGSDEVVALREYQPVVKWVVTVEAKRSAWAQAAAQAGRYLPASDRTFVALDAAHARRVVANASKLAASGIGVVTAQAPSSDLENAEVTVVAYPNARRPGLPSRLRAPNPAAKGLLGERVWRLRLDGQRSGPVYAVFGRDLSRA